MRFPATTLFLAFALLAADIAAPSAANGAGLTGAPVRVGSMSFIQDGLHNCGTVAMLLSWAKTRPQEAAELVRREENGSYRVMFTGESVVVTPTDLAAARKARVVTTAKDDDWARVVLTGFIKLKSGSGRLKFKVTDWIYAGEIAERLSDSPTWSSALKNESVDRHGRIRVGRPISTAAIKSELNSLRGKPMVAYSNRRIHIWAVMAYDPKHGRVLMRNPRQQNSAWMTAKEFGQKFELIVYSF